MHAGRLTNRVGLVFARGCRSCDACRAADSHHAELQIVTIAENAVCDQKPLAIVEAAVLSTAMLALQAQTASSHISSIRSQQTKAQAFKCARPFGRSRACRCVITSAKSADARPAGQGFDRRQLIAVPTLAAIGWLLQQPAWGATTGDAALREQLLSAIKENKSDEEVEKALRALSDQNPTRAPAKSDKLFGKWKLLWASSNSEVAKATRRNPLPSYSEQLVGEPGGEKKDRAANLINIGNGAVQVYLSSNAVQDPKSDDTILIGPPFYLELKLGGFKLPIQNTQKEGERKSLLGAEQNYYKQLYLESSGNPGDLRISEVTFGDPAAQGSIFVHERI